MNLLLTEKLPLRTTSVLGDFSVDLPLPHRYGDLRSSRFKLLRITDTEWFVADHAMEVLEVFVDNVATITYEAKLKSDDKGATWTIVVFNSAVAPTAVVTATGLGKLNPNTGALIENPADIAEDIAKLCGRTDTFGQLRGEASAASIYLAGSLDTVQPIKNVFDEVISSAGGVWCAGGYSLLYPTTVLGNYIVPLTRTQATNLSDLSSDLIDTCDILRLSYNANFDKPQSFIELTASPARYNKVVTELALPWIRTSVNAEAIGRRLLQRFSGERYTFTFDSTNLTLRPGTWVHLLSNPQWPFAEDPYVMITGVEITPDRNSVTVDAEVVRSTPTITLTAHSIAVPDTVGETLSVAFLNGIATFTIHDDKGLPLFGARVALDGSAPKTTNEKGQVIFSTTKGDHTLLIQATGFQDQVVSFTL